MAVTWTSETIVKSRFTSAGTTGLTSAQIEEFINEAEGFFTTLMKSYGNFGIGGGSFDATKHAILRRAATSYAVLCCITSAIISFQSMEQMYTIGDLAIAEFNACVSDLTKKDIRDYLVNL